MAASKSYTLRLTSNEVWALREAFEASFTDPTAKSKDDRAISTKLDALVMRRHRDMKAR